MNSNIHVIICPMKNLKFWRRTINHQTFLFSTKESEEEYYQLSYELAKKLLIGMAKRSRVFCSKKYDFVDYPFTYRERQLDTILLPELADLCKGLAFAEYPVTRNSKKKGHEVDDSKGRIDYWCIYKDYSFAIEVKHSYDNFHSNKTNYESLIQRWQTMNIDQLNNIKGELKGFGEKTKGIIRIALHFITSECGKEPSKEIINDYRSKEKEILCRLHDDLKHVTEPDFLSVWEIDDNMVLENDIDGRTYPGLILLSKFYKEIQHKGFASYTK